MGIRDPLEMLVFDEETYRRWCDKAASDSSRFVEELHGMEISNFGTDQINVFGVSSYPTAYDERRNHSSIVTKTECIVGKRKWSNTMKDPAKPGSTNPLDAYSTDYTDEQKKAGRKVLFGFLEGLAKRGGVYAVDRNNLITRDDFAFKVSQML